MSDKTELEVLKEKADKMGIKYHPNTGVDKLREKVNAELSDEKEPTTATTNKSSKKELTEAQKRAQKKKDALALVRVEVDCKDPNKKDWEGEFFTVSNSVTGTVRKYVQFNTPWHIPRIIFNVLKDKKLQRFKSVKGKEGTTTRESYLTNAYSVIELEPLTDKELKELADDQRARNAID